MKIKKLKKVTIKRKTWLHGHKTTTRQKSDSGNSLDMSWLLDSKGYMCCLGQWCEQAGVPREELRAVSSPADLPMRIPLLTKNDNDYGNRYNSVLASNMMTLNDSCQRSTQEQEKELVKLAKVEGVKLVFVD